MGSVGEIAVCRLEKIQPGYVLYSAYAGEAFVLIDREGHIVHEWPVGGPVKIGEMLPNGHLVAIVKEWEDEYPGMMLELDWDGKLVWQADVAAHHDFHRLDNGHTLVVCREYVENDLIRANGVKSDSILELNVDGDIVWAWHSDQHIEQMAERVPITLPRPDHDWGHMNTVESLPQGPAAEKDERFRAGNVLFSCRNIDTIGVIDRRTDDVVWAWGPGVLDKQHMPTMLPSGNILIYDNGCEAKRTRILELDPIAEEIVWEYQGDPPESFSSNSRGSSERLGNGNTFIAESNTGRLFEVTPEGEIVWQFLTPDLLKDGRRQPLYRALRYPAEDVQRLFD